MRGSIGIAIGLIVGLASTAAAQPGATAVDPYFMVVFDNSGSMDASTGSGSNTCGQARNRISDAKCVLQRVIHGYGDVRFGLTRFAETCDINDSCSSSCTSSCGCDCTYLTCPGCDDDGDGCPAAGALPNQGQVLVPIIPENAPQILEWVDYRCSSCRTGVGTGPELEAHTWTPIAGALRAVRRYFEGSDPTFPTSPIAGDVYAGCRPMHVILLTDGEETCASDAETQSAAAELRATTFGGTTYDITTYVIAFGITPGDADTEAIAASGGTDAPGAHRAFYAGNETELAVAFSQIIADALLQEVCNGADDDCDTLVDEGFALYCDRPGGHPAPDLCLDPGERVCDGADDNCDGEVDEGVGNACGTCGPAPAEVCNGVDDDCDGAIDEGVCGGCVPSSEICDGLDSDCDGRVDEGLTRPCGSSVGECTVGVQSCTAGAWGTCSGTGPSPEVCDDRDNDCDGVVDGITRACGTSVGECQAGLELCTGGAFGACLGGVGPVPEVCDARDNDCDGATDESNPGGGGLCGSAIGECDPGTLTCLAGALTCVGGTSGMPESCNTRDDDCDGAVDEGIPPAGACGSATGECRAGQRLCVDGAVSCVGARGPVEELCDGLDNDCDGPVDEMNPGGGGACGSDVGDCARGANQCVGGALTCVGATGPRTETCNRTDEDCDGLIDERNPDGGGACGSSDVGECELGALVCVDGALTCLGEGLPSAELCDGLDNDCDGSTDEGNPEGDEPCGSDTGECIAGTTQCVDGALVCQGAVGPTPEVCDGLDNDCDSVIDDGIPVGAPCGSDLGECQPGRFVCREGELVCEGDVGPNPESCDLLDNDCDGPVDEGLALGTACGSSVGLCVPGTVQCIDGRPLCTGAVPAGREVCDCLDNDCDGVVDEDPSTGPICPGESACVSCQCALPCVPTEFGFSCPTGRFAFEHDGACHCVAEGCDADACATETIERDGAARCAPGSAELGECVCRNNECTFACDGVTCADGLACDPHDPAGRCVESSCRGLGCPDGELCDAVSGKCEPDPCSTTTCAADQACRGGVCETSCATVSCEEGQRCAGGVCGADRCARRTCRFGEVCDPSDGACVPDLCPGRVCGVGTVCDALTGSCDRDPCVGLWCPAGQRCAAGECEMIAAARDAGGGSTVMDAGRDRVLVAGSGGCGVGPRGREPDPGWLALGVLALVLRRRSGARGGC